MSEKKRKDSRTINSQERRRTPLNFLLLEGQLLRAERSLHFKENRSKNQENPKNTVIQSIKFGCFSCLQVKFFDKA